MNDSQLRNDLTDLLDRIDPRRRGAYVLLEREERLQRLHDDIADARSQILAEDPASLDMTTEDALRQIGRLEAQLGDGVEQSLDRLQEEQLTLEEQLAILEADRERLQSAMEWAEQLGGYLERWQRCRQIEAASRSDQQTADQLRTASELEAHYHALEERLTPLREAYDDRLRELRPLLERRLALLREALLLLEMSLDDQPTLDDLSVNATIQDIKNALFDLDRKNEKLESDLTASQKEQEEQALLERPDVRDRAQWQAAMRSFGYPVSGALDADQVLPQLLQEVRYQRRKHDK